MLSSIRLIRDSTSRRRRSAARRSRSRASAIKPRVVEGRGGVAAQTGRAAAGRPRETTTRAAGRRPPRPSDACVELIGATSALAPSPVMAEASSGSHASRRPDCSPSLVMASPTRPAAGVSRQPDERRDGRGLSRSRPPTRVVAERHHGQRVPHAPRRGLSEIGGRQPAALLGRPIGGRAEIPRLFEPLPAGAEKARRRERQEVADDRSPPIRTREARGALLPGR